MKVAITLSARDYDVVLFDLDGVLTRTARVHAAAWKMPFDGFLEQRGPQAGKPFVPFDIAPATSATGHAWHSQSAEGLLKMVRRHRGQRRTESPGYATAT